MKIREGELAPFWYGFAWWNYEQYVAVVYPIPFNFLARWAREVYMVLRTSGVQRRNKYHEIGYRQGREDGERYGVIRGRREHQEELLRNIAAMDLNARIEKIKSTPQAGTLKQPIKQ